MIGRLISRALCFVGLHDWREMNGRCRLCGKGDVYQVVDNMFGAAEGADHGFTFTDRYAALGIKCPDPATMCEGDCEGTGWVPVMADDPSPTYRALWMAAEAVHPNEPGYAWHFVKCPTCNGTGKRP